jgi:hypothetical protein
MPERLTIRCRQGRPAGPSRRDRSAAEALDDAGNVVAATIDNAHPQGGLQRNRPRRVRIIRSYSVRAFGVQFRLATVWNTASSDGMRDRVVGAGRSVMSYDLSPRLDPWDVLA